MSKRNLLSILFGFAVTTMASTSYAGVSEQQCLEAFQTSSAAKSCKDVVARGSRGGMDACTIQTSCPRSDIIDEYKDSQVAINFRDVSKLVNCNGSLRIGDCKK